MSNLEELDKLNDALNENITLLKENADFLDPKLVNIISLNVVIATYLPSIAKSLAIIADNVSEKDKED